MFTVHDRPLHIMKALYHSYLIECCIGSDWWKVCWYGRWRFLFCHLITVIITMVTLWCNLLLTVGWAVLIPSICSKADGLLSNSTLSLPLERASFLSLSSEYKTCRCKWNKSKSLSMELPPWHSRQCVSLIIWRSWVQSSQEAGFFVVF